jgi:type 1 fimbria pilin
MTRRHRWTMIGHPVLVLATALSSCAAWANDTLRFDVTGAITPSCDLATDRARIDMGTVSAAELPGQGAVSRWRSAALTLSDCVGATRARVTVRAPADSTDPRYLSTRGDAKGVAIELRTADGKAILPDGTTPVDFDLGVPTPELRFEARYVRLGRLGAGDAPATALIQITWE